MTEEQRENLKELGPKSEALKHVALNEYTLKEGEPWHMRVTFKVHNEIVLGLKLCFTIKKALLPTIKSEMFVGNYPPTKTAHIVDLED